MIHKNRRLNFPAGFMVFLLLFFGSPLVIAAAAYTLSVTSAGTGVGTVNSLPAGIACESGVSGGCSAVFTALEPLTLTATSDWKSLFDSWGGACSGTDTVCVLTPDADAGVTANFKPNYQAALLIMHPVLEPKFATISDAYDYAYSNAKNNFTLTARENTFTENLLLTHQVSFTLEGGKNSGYYLNIGFSTLHGYLEVQQGTIVIDSLIIE